MTRDLQQRYRIRNCDSAFQADRWHALDPHLCYPGAGMEDLFAGDGEICRSFLGQNPQIAEEMNRVVRASLLYEDELVIDAHDLLDGIFFMALGPDYFHSLIDDRRFSSFRLIIESRRDSLQEALKAFIARPEPTDKKKQRKNKPVFSLISAINPGHDYFCWTRLTKEQRDVLEDLREAKTVDVSECAQRVLETCLNMPVGSLAFVRHRWDEWFRAVREGFVDIMPVSECEWRQRTGSFSIDMEHIMEAHRKSGVAYICDDPVESHRHFFACNAPGNGEQSDDRHQSAETLISCLEGAESRSDGFMEIKHARDDHPGLGPGFFDRLKDWYDTCYQLELAHQRKAQLLVLDTEGAKRADEYHRHGRSSDLSVGSAGQSYMRWASNRKNKLYAEQSLFVQPLPSGIVSAVSDLSSHNFRVFIDGQKNGKSRVSRWRFAGSRLGQGWSRLNLLHIISNYPEEGGVGWPLVQIILLPLTIGLAFAGALSGTGGWAVMTALLATAVQEASDAKDLVDTSRNMGREVWACVIR